MDCGASPQRRGPILAEEFGGSSTVGYARGAAKGGKVSSVKRSRSLRLGFVSLGAAAALILGTVVVGPASADPLSEKKAEAARIGEQLAQLEDRQQELNGQYEKANYELRQAQEKVNAAKVLAAQTAAEADVRREDLRQYAVAAYQSGNDSPEFDALISNDASTGVQKRSYLQSLSGSRQDLVDALNAARQKAEEDGVRLKAAEDASTAKAAEIEQLKKAADDATNQQAAINARVQGELRVLVQAENARIAAAAAAARAAASARSSGGRATAAPNPNPGQVRPYSGAMWKSTIRISESQLQPGDLVFWGAGGSEHVAIYIGGNQILHTAKGVAITPMNGWWTYGPIMSFGRIP